MKRAIYGQVILEKAYLGGLLLVFGLIVLHAPLSVYFGTLFADHALVIKAWKELLMGALLVLAAIVVTRRRAWELFVRDPIVLLSLALAVLYAVSLQYGHGPRPYGAGLLIDLRYVLYLVLVYMYARLFPAVRRPMLVVGAAGAGIVVGFGLLQFVLPTDFLRVLGYSRATITPYTTIDNYEGLVRLQSTLRGPNPLGAYGLVVALVGSAFALTSRTTGRRRAALWLLVAGAVVVTFASYSRSAYLGLAAGAAVIAGVFAGKKLLRSRKAVGTVAAGLVIISVGLLLIRQTTFYSSVIVHEVEGSGPAVNSNEGHGKSLRSALANVLRAPFGYGTGSTGSASLLSPDGGGNIIENQYLFVAHEAGWAGLALFIGLYAVLLVRTYRSRRDPLALGVFASGLGLAVVGLVLPVFADDTVSIVWFGLAGLSAAWASTNAAPGKGIREPAAE